MSSYHDSEFVSSTDEHIDHNNQDDIPPIDKLPCSSENSEYNSSQDEEYVESDTDDSSSLESLGGEHMAEVEEELCHLEGDNFMDGVKDSKLAGLVGGLVHLRESQRDQMKMWGNIWNSLLKQNEKIIMLSQEILQEVRKRPASDDDVLPAKSKIKGRGKAKVPVDCSVSFTTYNCY